MFYNKDLANRIRDKLLYLKNIEEKEMMGGLTFMYNNKMCIGIIKDELMCRINPEIHEEVIKKNGCRTMDFTKKLFKGYILINLEGIKNNNDFDYFINLAIEFNSKAKASKKKK